MLSLLYSGPYSFSTDQLMPPVVLVRNWVRMGKGDDDSGCQVSKTTMCEADKLFQLLARQGSSAGGGDCWWGQKQTNFEVLAPSIHRGERRRMTKSAALILLPSGVREEFSLMIW
jgi:hypothetical protein